MSSCSSRASSYGRRCWNASALRPWFGRKSQKPSFPIPWFFPLWFLPVFLDQVFVDIRWRTRSLAGLASASTKTAPWQKKCFQAFQAKQVLVMFLFAASRLLHPVGASLRSEGVELLPNQPLIQAVADSGPTWHRLPTARARPTTMPGHRTLESCASPTSWPRAWIRPVTVPCHDCPVHGTLLDFVQLCSAEDSVSASFRSEDSPEAGPNTSFTVETRRANVDSPSSSPWVPSVTCCFPGCVRSWL